MQHRTPSPVEEIRHALDVLTPRWTCRVLNLLHQHGPLRSQQITDRLPHVTTAAATHQILSRMHTSGLLTRPERGVYAPAPLAHDAHHVQHALVSWHSQHLTNHHPAGWTHDDRAEDALARLRDKGALEVLTTLRTHGALRPETLRHSAGLASGTFHYRTQQLHHDGLITRLGSGQRAPYALTPAADHLDPVYAQLRRFSRRCHSTTTETSKLHHALDARAHAAHQRSPNTPMTTQLFSHPPPQQPHVPAHITALFHPSRTR